MSMLQVGVHTDNPEVLSGDMLVSLWDKVVLLLSQAYRDVQWRYEEPAGHNPKSHLKYALVGTATNQVRVLGR